MKFSEEELVDKLVNDVIHNTNKRDEVIDDLTEEQAYELFDKYGNFSRILLAFPKHLLKDKNFILKCEEKYDINAALYVDDSLLADLDYVLRQIGKDKFIYCKLIENYEKLPKEDKYFIPIIKLSIEYGYYKEVGNLIDKILDGNDLKIYRKALAEINRNLKILTSKSNRVIAEILKIRTEKSMIKQVKKLEIEINNKNENLQV